MKKLSNYINNVSDIELVLVDSVNNGQITCRKITGFNSTTNYYKAQSVNKIYSNYVGQQPEVNKIYTANDSTIIGFSALQSLKIAIPTDFVSNTPEGYIIDRNSHNWYRDAYVVFNLNKTDGDYAWYTNVTPTEQNPVWISIKVPVAFVPKKIYIMNQVQSPANFKDAIFQASNNGSDWVDLLTITDSPNTVAYEQYHNINTNVAYTYFRMLFTSSWGQVGGVSIQCFTIYKSIVQ